MSTLEKLLQEQKKTNEYLEILTRIQVFRDAKLLYPFSEKELRKTMLSVLSKSYQSKKVF